MHRVLHHRLILLGLLAAMLAAAGPVSSDGWTTMAPAPASFGHGAAIAYPGTGDYLYALQGHNSPTFYRYSVSGNSWSTMAPAPDAVHHGGAIAGTGGNYLYVLRAHSTATFWRYSISGNCWSRLPNAPGALEHGASLVHAGGNHLYALRGKDSTTVYRYSISDATWTTLASLPAKADHGAALAYPGSGNYLYALRGKDSQDFYRYSISGNSWTPLASTPGKIHYIAGALSSSGDADFLYALQGSHSSSFWRYSIPDDQWTPAASTPATVCKGAALCSYPSTGRYIFATRGDNSPTFYRYDGVDTRAPEVTVSQAVTQPDPTAASPIHFTVQFSEPVTGFAANDVALTGTAGATTVTVTGGPATYGVAISGMTDDGTVTVSIPAGAATDGTHPSLASTSPDDTVLFSATAPTVTVAQAAGQADPTAASPIHFTVEFSEPVTGFEADDVAVSGSAGANGVTVTGGPETYDVEVGMTSDGTVTVAIPAGAAVDAVGLENLASSSVDNTATYDTTPPAVTVKADPAQADPTATSPITFIVEFNEPVSGFDAGDVIVMGTAGATTVTVAGGQMTYTVEVGGMTSDGTVTVSIPAGAAADPAGNPSGAPTTEDNTVTYDTTPPTVLVHPGTTTTEFTVEFSEPVTGFGDQTGDVSVNGENRGAEVTVTGGGTTYTVDVQERADDDSVTIVVPPGAASDPAGNLSLGSETSSDDSDGSGAGRLKAGYCATSANDKPDFERTMLLFAGIAVLSLTRIGRRRWAAGARRS